MIDKLENSVQIWDDIDGGGGVLVVVYVVDKMINTMR